ncbi:tripartite tricarboxylate transporter TctB family protein [Roseomonas sp. ROY-5-3]|uniref:Tripartite tricarboxylate transporter TctB family protein n=2 Tax=Acetobacterales TaxID=3120395 RepID=A0ABS6HEE9_9PROT|nr:tripartite tricarboxylate transporter TctB family protein [Roseomonas oleicola]
MQRRDWTDIIGGSLLLIFGLWFLWHAQNHYNLGELRRMGPGAFPAGLGLLNALFGLLILVPAFFRKGEMPVPAIRPLLAIIAGGLSFAFLIEPAGLVPATVALVFVVALAEQKQRWLRTAILAAALSVMAVLVFTKGLGIPVPAFRWWSY